MTRGDRKDGLAGTFPFISSRNASLARFAVVMLAATVIVSITANSYWLSIFTSACATALVGAGAAVLYGQLGLVSLCQFALAGVGGWVSLRVHHAAHLPFELSLVAGGMAASGVGMIWGLPALRMRGLYLALVTLMLAGAFQVGIN